MNLQEIKDRHSKAPPGPYTLDIWDDLKDQDNNTIVYVTMDESLGFIDQGTEEFIIHSWQDIKDLIEEVERLRMTITGLSKPYKPTMRVECKSQPCKENTIIDFPAFEGTMDVVTPPNGEPQVYAAPCRNLNVVTKKGLILDSAIGEISNEGIPCNAVVELCGPSPTPSPAYEAYRMSRLIEEFGGLHSYEEHDKWPDPDDGRCV